MSRIILYCCIYRKASKMMTLEKLKPVEVESCAAQTAEMDFLIAQKLMYRVTTVVWPQANDTEDKTYKKTYEMTLSELLENFSVNLDKNIENIISIKQI